MVINDNGMRFTNEVYATRAEVSKALNIPFIDKIWNEILEYRSQFAVNLPLNNVDGGRYSVCLAPNVTNKINSVERKITKLILKVNNFTASKAKKDFIDNCFVHSLNHVAQDLHVNVDETILKLIRNNTVSALTPDKIAIQKYSTLIDKILSEEANNISPKDFVNLCYSTFFGNSYGSIYRNHDNFPSGIYNNIYNEAPHSVIEPMMNNLYEFIDNSNESIILNSILILFYFIYIKPFDGYNEEIAILLAKQYISIHEFGGISSIIDFEFICDNMDKISAINEECQKTCDLTYFINLVLQYLDSSLDTTLDNLVKASAELLKNDYYQTEKDIENKDGEEISNTGNDNANGLQNNPQKDDSSAKEGIEDDKNTKVANEHLNYTQQLAITTVTTGYSEETAKEIEEFLVESNPNLSRSQAYFYARHCTLGKFYTIAQFKKEVGCAYETARTSMDKLVNEGYYSKEGYKNKFLYTPIKRK